MPAPRGRDLEWTRQRLGAWLAERLPDARRLALSAFTGPGATGFSSDTLLFDLDFEEHGRARSMALVLRLEPIGFRVFPDYDVARQFRILEALARSEVPVPRARWLETDATVLGTPFYVMDRVEGRIPTDNPPYHVGGWLAEAAPEERAAVWWSGLEALACIHRLDWRALGLGFLDAAAPGADRLERELVAWERFLAWAAPEGAPPPIAAAFGRLRATRPRRAAPAALCWGDSRIGNMIFRGGRCAAALDWEMAAIADPVMDLAWFLYMDRHHSEGCGAPRLAGLPGRAETAARWAERTGRGLEHLEYYELFAAFRFAAIMIRVGRQMKHYGVLPADSSFDADNTATRLLARVVDERR